MDTTASYIIALLFALLVHGMVIALITFNWTDASEEFDEIKPYYIEATVVAENPYTARKEKVADREKSKRENRLNRRRLDEMKFLKEQAEWEAEQKRKQQEEKVVRTLVPDSRPDSKSKVDNTETEVDVDHEAVRSAFEQELALAVVDEQNMRKAVTDDEKAMAYVGQIQREIIQNWSRPPSARNGMQTLLRVRLVPTGEVVDVKIEDSSGNDAFDRSAVQAVRKSERFVVPSDTLRFERNFREFTVLFKPDDLRL